MHFVDNQVERLKEEDKDISHKKVERWQVIT